MLCLPFVVDEVEGFGWVLDWPCTPEQGAAVIGVLDPTEAMRTHICPDTNGESDTPSDVCLTPPCLADGVGGVTGPELVTGRPPCTPTNPKKGQRPAHRFVPDSAPTSEREEVTP